MSCLDIETVVEFIYTYYEENKNLLKISLRSKIM